MSYGSGQFIEIDNIPPLLRVKTLINGRLPPAIFLAVPRPAKQQMEIEEFVHMAILPVDLQVTIRREVRFAVYQRLAEDLAELRRFQPNGGGSEHLLTQMENIWPTLSDEHRHRLTADGLAHKPSEFKGEF